MRLIGSIYEWIEHKPDAFLANGKFLQEGVSIYAFEKLTKPRRFVYPCKEFQHRNTENIYSIPPIDFGSSILYTVKGTFRYSCTIVHWPLGQSSIFPLSEEMLEDKDWYEFTAIPWENRHPPKLMNLFKITE